MMTGRRHGLLNLDTLKSKILAISATITGLTIIGVAVVWTYAQVLIIDENHIKKVSSGVCEDMVRPICKTVTETNYILREVADSIVVQRALSKMKADSTLLSLQHRR